MPYYLVTHTSLVEGENEVKAAQKVLAKLRSDSSVEFLVKFDESITRQVPVVDAVTSQAALASSQSDQSQFLEDVPKATSESIPVAGQVTDSDLNSEVR